MAEARLCIGVPICWQRVKKCEWIHEWEAAICDKPCGWSKAWSGGKDGSIRQNICSRGFALSSLSDQLLPKLAQATSTGSIPLASDRAEWDPIVFDTVNHRVSMRNLRGYFEQ